MALEFIGVVLVMTGWLGYSSFGLFSKTFLRAVTYSFLWGAAMFVLLGALAGESQPFGFDFSAWCISLRGHDDVIFTVDDYTSGVTSGSTQRL